MALIYNDSNQLHMINLFNIIIQIIDNHLVLYFGFYLSNYKIKKYTYFTIQYMYCLNLVAVIEYTLLKNSDLTLVVANILVLSDDSHEHNCHLLWMVRLLFSKVWITRLWIEALDSFVCLASCIWDLVRRIFLFLYP